jgi:hypothetical protein
LSAAKFPLVLFDFLALGGHRPVVLGQIVGELLVRRLGEHSLLPEVGRQVGVRVADGRVRRLGCK